MLKLIYLARRKPGFTQDEFVRRWRRHGALGMSQPFWRFALGYVQAEPLRPTPIVGASEDYDAVACYMVRDEMFTGMTEEDMPGALAMAEDELETFSGPIPEVSLWVTEEHVKVGALGGITAFLFCAEADAARALALDAGACAGLHRVVLNLRDDGAGDAHANTLPFAAVVELAASGIEALKETMDSVGAVERAALAMVTREAVLWDRLA